MSLWFSHVFTRKCKEINIPTFFRNIFPVKLNLMLRYNYHNIYMLEMIASIMHVFKDFLLQQQIIRHIIHYHSYIANEGEDTSSSINASPADGGW